jgi:hypothetical protein
MHPVRKHSIHQKAELALISFLIVYLELVVIRWLGTEVRIFSYFKNLPLLAAFLGMGSGCILARRQRGYFRFSPVLLLAVSAVISLANWGGYTHITFVDPYEHYFLGNFDFTNPLSAVFKGSIIIICIVAACTAGLLCRNSFLQLIQERTIPSGCTRLQPVWGDGRESSGVHIDGLGHQQPQFIDAFSLLRCRAVTLPTAFCDLRRYSIPRLIRLHC